MEHAYSEAIRRRFQDLLPKYDQELLARYYLNGEPAEAICRSLGISIHEFQARKAVSKEVLTAGLTPPCRARCSR
jgi:hypothetical protein